MAVLKIKELKKRYRTASSTFYIRVSNATIDAELSRYADTWNRQLHGLEYWRGGSQERFDNPCKYITENVHRLPPDYKARRVGDRSVKVSGLKFLEVPIIQTKILPRTDIMIENIFPYFVLARLLTYENGMMVLEVRETEYDEQVLVDPAELYEIGKRSSTR